MIAHVKENSVCDSERKCFCRDYYEWALLFTGSSHEGVDTNITRFFKIFLRKCPLNPTSSIDACNFSQEISPDKISF